MIGCKRVIGMVCVLCCDLAACHMYGKFSACMMCVLCGGVSSC